MPSLCRATQGFEEQVAQDDGFLPVTKRKTR